MAKPRVVLLQLYRLAVLGAICWLVREQHVRLRIQGDRPISLEEIEPFFLDAAQLKPDHSSRAGMFVVGLDGRELGYVVRTSPWSDHIKGYAGPTDVLVAMDTTLKVLGFTVHHSDDTKVHVGDVVTDRHFKKTWKDMMWDEVAAMDLKEAGVEGVSGSTMTSMAVAESVVHRLKSANDQLAATPRWQVNERDIGLAVVVVLACVLAFTHMKGRRRLRQVFQICVLGYVGFLNGDLIAQSLVAGWAKSGVALHAAPGLVLLVAAALVVPWTTRKPLYCLHICPHGAVQEWAGKLLPRHWRLAPPSGVTRGLRWLPPLLLAIVVFVVMTAVPIDLADIEPFDAYIIRTAGWATITIAVVGLVASLFVPQAYCRYGCPTGALLEFVRFHGPHDVFGRRDVVAALMLALAAGLYWQHTRIQEWLLGPL